jgi:very-short-patch-repair endonuclease
MPERRRVDQAVGVIVGQVVAQDKLERAKALRRASTRAERTLWQSLRGNRLEGLHFRRQQVVDGLILDFYCHSARLAVEVDGEVHRGQREYDEERERVLARRGILVLRVENDQVEQSLPSVLDRILEAVRPPSALVSEQAFPLPESGRGTGG